MLKEKIMKNKFPIPKNYHYFDRYIKIVEHFSKNPQQEGYVEKHHIIPKSLKPEYAKETWNLVAVSGRVHFILHYLLWMAYRDHKTWNAFKFMVSKNPYQNRYFNSRLYESLKKSSMKNTKESNEKRSKALTGIKRSQETRAKMSEWQKGKPKPWVSYDRSQETRDKISNWQKGKPKPYCSGSRNAKSKPIVFRGISYESIRQCSLEHGISDYMVKKELETS